MNLGAQVQTRAHFGYFAFCENSTATCVLGPDVLTGPGVRVDLQATGSLGSIWQVTVPDKKQCFSNFFFIFFIIYFLLISVTFLFLNMY